MERPVRALLRRIGVGLFLALVVVFTSFLLVKLGAGPTDVLLGGPSPGVEERAQLVQDYGLDRPAFVQLVRYAIRVLGGELGRSWLTGESVLSELLHRLPATLELMLYAILLGTLMAVPTGMAAAFARDTAEDRTVRGTSVLGEAMPPFFLALLLLLVFFRWLDIAPAPSGRISIVLSPPPTITGSYFISALVPNSWIDRALSAWSALALGVPTFWLGILLILLFGVQLRWLPAVSTYVPFFEDPLGALRNILLPALTLGTYVSGIFARAQGMSREMLTIIALRGALPAIGGGLAAQSAALLSMTALVEYVFAWGGIGQYGLEAMAKADFAAVQGFILASAAIAATVHLLHAVIRRLARIRIRRA